MTVIAVFEVRPIADATDQQRRDYDEYRSKVPALIASFGGTYLIRAGSGEAIEGAPALGSKILAMGDGTIEGITGPDVTRAAQEGDAIALAAFNEIGEWLGYAISGFSSIIDPQSVVIGGGVIDAGEILLDPIRTSLKKNSPMRSSHDMPKVVAAKLGNDAGIVGVADLARIA